MKVPIIGVATILIVIFAIAGAIVTITDPAALSFKDYMQSVIVGAAGLGIGRGLDQVTRP